MHDDGVIKYQCEWVPGDPLSPEFIEPVREWRDRLYKLGLIGVYPDGIGFGNISQRLSPSSFVVSGTQTGHHPVTTPAHYTLVDAWDIAENTLHCVGPVKASSESLTHAALYDYSPAIHGVIHIHHQALWEAYCQVLPTTEASVPYGTPAMAYEMWRLFRDRDLADKQVLVMAGHESGLLAFGATLAEAAAVLLRLLPDGER